MKRILALLSQTLHCNVKQTITICISQIMVEQLDSLPAAGVLCVIKQFCARYRHDFIAKSGYWSDGFVQPIPDQYKLARI